MDEGGSRNPFLRLFSKKKTDDEQMEQEIISMVDEAHEQGALRESESMMIHNVLALDEKEAKDIMTHRKNIVAIDGNTPFSKAMDFIMEETHSRFPVYEEDIDNIIGVLHVKDMMIEMRKHPLKKGDVRQMLRQPFFIPETKEADELFRIMQETRHHMALLVDEYGGFSGIVTIENLVEEIMGDINEEYEEVVPEIECVREDEYKIDGGVLIDDLNDELGLKLETENYDTLSGYLIEKLGHIPAKEDRDIIETDGLIFKIEEVKDNRITQVRLRMKDLK